MKHREVKRLLAGGALGLAAVVAAPGVVSHAAPEVGEVEIDWGDISDIIGDGDEGDTGNGDGNQPDAGGDTGNEGSENGTGGAGSENGGNDNTENGGNDGSGDDGNKDDEWSDDILDGGDNQPIKPVTPPVPDGSQDGKDEVTGQPGADAGQDAGKPVEKQPEAIEAPAQEENGDVAPKTGDMGGLMAAACSGLAGLGLLSEAIRRKFRR